MKNVLKMLSHQGNANLTLVKVATPILWNMEILVRYVKKESLYIVGGSRNQFIHMEINMTFQKALPTLGAVILGRKLSLSNHFMSMPCSLRYHTHNSKAKKSPQCPLVNEWIKKLHTCTLAHTWAGTHRHTVQPRRKM